MEGNKIVGLFQCTVCHMYAWLEMDCCVTMLPSWRSTDNQPGAAHRGGRGLDMAGEEMSQHEQVSIWVRLHHIYANLPVDFNG